MIRFLIIVGVVIWAMAVVAYLVVMSTMPKEKYEQLMRKWGD